MASNMEAILASPLTTAMNNTANKTMAFHVLILVPAFVGLAFSVVLYLLVKRIKLEPRLGGEEMEAKLNDDQDATESEKIKNMVEIYNTIIVGAKSFLFEEYKICAAFILLFGSLVFIMVSHAGTCTEEQYKASHTCVYANSSVAVNTKGMAALTSWNFKAGGITAASFAIGGITSMVSGYLGMMIAVFANARTTREAWGPNGDEPENWKRAFNAAFRAGGVMGYSLAGMGVLMLYLLLLMFQGVFTKNGTTDWPQMMESIAGFGLGGSSIALFGRVGGGIYTKAADVGADLAGKVVEDLNEDSPYNPATIADNVGDNVGDVAGMGSDLFGSFAEATCAGLVVAANSDLTEGGLPVLAFPLYISSAGIIMCMLTSFVATDCCPVRSSKTVERVLKVQLFVSTSLMTAVMYPICIAFLPYSVKFTTLDHAFEGLPTRAFICVVAGLWGGCLIGFITEYYTSASYEPVKEVARSCVTGAATNIIYGLALGYKSAIVPVTIISAIVFAAFNLLNMYGVALSALGMIGTLATCLSIDVYGPVCDNAGGIAEMSECPGHVRDLTDALDAAGNTTAAIGKGFAIGSAALVSLALFGGFVTRAGNLNGNVQLLEPITFCFLIFGAMLPYWFSAMTMKSVGLAAMEMVEEVARQFEATPELLWMADPTNPKFKDDMAAANFNPKEHPNLRPDSQKCIAISTKASLKEMILPGLLVIMSPILTGLFFGVSAVCGLLAGGMSSGVQLALSASNTGGAWDNAKKYVEAGNVKDKAGVVQGKGSEVHKAAVTGDTVGDPLKDTSGPALNILMKLMAIISLVFAQFFMSINDGRGIFQTTKVGGSNNFLCTWPKDLPLCKH